MEVLSTLLLEIITVNISPVESSHITIIIRYSYDEFMQKHINLNIFGFVYASRRPNLLMI